MHIIFGTEQAQELAKKYTVLELDTFRLGENGPIVTAYCPIETVPFDELPFLVETKAKHEDLIINYHARAWESCLSTIDQLNGKWNGKLDSFYSNLHDRIQNLINNPPPEDWTSIIQK